MFDYTEIFAYLAERRKMVFEFKRNAFFGTS